jgi:hypothetical protein
MLSLRDMYCLLEEFHDIGVAINGDKWSFEQSQRAFKLMDKKQEGIVSKDSFLGHYRDLLMHNDDESFEADTEIQLPKKSNIYICT